MGLDEAVHGVEKARQFLHFIEDHQVEVTLPKAFVDIPLKRRQVSRKTIFDGRVEQVVAEDPGVGAGIGEEGRLSCPASAEQEKTAVGR